MLCVPFLHRWWGSCRQQIQAIAQGAIKQNDSPGEQSEAPGRSRTQDQKTRTVSTCWSNPGGISLILAIWLRQRGNRQRLRLCDLGALRDSERRQWSPKLRRAIKSRTDKTFLASGPVFAMRFRKPIECSRTLPCPSFPSFFGESQGKPTKKQGFLSLPNP